MTITSKKQLSITQRHVARLEQSIASARERLAGQPDLLEDLIAIHARQLRELQREICEYLGLPPERKTRGRGAPRKG